MGDSTASASRSDASRTLPAGTPSWITQALLDRTIEVWQPHYKEPLTAADAVAMICDASRLMEALEPGL